VQRFPSWTVETLIAIAFLTGCDDSNVHTLYRSSPTVGEIHGEKARIHVATFDAAQSEEYNRLNCETARELFVAQGVTVRYLVRERALPALTDETLPPTMDR
jgi:hypothetical protein